MLISLLLLGSLVPHPGIDQLLFRVRGQSRCKRVAKCVPAGDHFPLFILDGPQKVIRCFTFCQWYKSKPLPNPNVRLPLLAIGRKRFVIQETPLETPLPTPGHFGFMAEQAVAARVLTQPLLEDLGLVGDVLVLTNFALPLRLGGFRPSAGHGCQRIQGDQRNEEGQSPCEKPINK